MADESQNLKIHQEINRTLEARSKVLKAQTDVLEGQVRFAMELCKALKCEELEGMEERLKGIRGKLEEAAKSAQQMAEGQQNVTAATDKSSKSMTKLNKSTTTTAAAATVLGVSLTNSLRAGKEQALALWEGFKSIVSTIGSMSSAILSIPGRIFSGLVEAANEVQQAMVGIRQEFENAREQFGDMSSNEGAAMAGAFKNVSKSIEDTGGVSSGALFGRHEGGVQRRMAFINQMAKDLGDTFHLLSKEFEEDADAIIRLNKGLGLSAEGFKALGAKAIADGTSIKKTLLDVAKVSQQVGKRFNVSAKLISRGIGEMTGDFLNFGNTTQEEMAATVVHMAKLGTSVKDVMGMIDKFDNFESAAEGAAQLAQAFGMNVDVMKMVRSQSPADMFDQLRESFFATGKSIEDLSRQEKKHLSAMTGLQGSALKTAFSLSSQGKSYEQIKEGAEDAAKQEKENKKVMLEAAKAAGKFAEAGLRLMGILDAVFGGLYRGLTRSEPMMDFLWNLHAWLMAFYTGGVKLGTMLGELGGEFGIFETLKDIFDPAEITDLFGKAFGIGPDGKKIPGTGILGAIYAFFHEFEDGDASPANLSEKIITEFQKYFSKNAPAWQRLKEMFLNGLAVVISGIGEILPMAISKLAEFVQDMADFIRDPQAFISAADQGIGGTIIGSLIKLKDDLLVDGGPVDQLGDAFVDLMRAVWEKHGDKIKKVGAVLGGIVIGKMMLVMMASVVKGALSMLIAGKIASMMGTAAETAGGPGGGGVRAMGKSIKHTMVGFAKGIRGFITQMALIEPSMLWKAAKNMTFMTITFLVQLGLFAFALKGVAMVLSDVKWSNLMKAFISIGLSLGALSFLSGAALALEPSIIIKAGQGLILASLFLSGGLLIYAGGIAGAAAMLSMVSWGSIIKMFLTMAAAIGATYLLIGVSLPFGADGGLTLGAATYGLFLAALFFTGGVLLYAGALWVMSKTLGKLPYDTIMKSMGMLYLALGATALLIGGGVLLVKFAALMGPAALAITLAAGFLAVMGIVFAAALESFGNSFKSINVGKITSAIGLVIFSLGLIASMAAVGAAFVFMGPLVLLLAGGIALAASFLDDASANLAGLIENMAKIPISGDPKAMESRLAVVKNVLEALASLSGLGSKMAMLGLVAEIFGGEGTTMSGVMEAVSDFLDRTSDTMLRLVEKMVELSQQFTDKELEKVQPVSQLISALATLFASLAEPLGSLASAGGAMAAFISHITMEDSPVQQMITGLKGFFDVLNVKLPGLVTAFKQAASLIDDSEDFTIKSEALGVAFKGIETLASAAQKLGITMKELRGRWYLGEEDIKLSSMMHEMQQLVGGHATLNFIRAVKEVKWPTGAEFQQVEKGILRLEGFAKRAIDRFVSINEKFDDNRSVLEKIIGKPKDQPAVQLVRSIVEQANAINETLSGDSKVAVNAKLEAFGNIMGLVDETIKVATKPIQIHMQVNVNMNADQIATQLADPGVVTVGPLIQDMALSHDSLGYSPMSADEAAMSTSSPT